MSRTRHILLIIALLGVALSAGVAPSPATAAPGPVSIVEQNPDDASTWGFRPTEMVVKAGTTVVWRNTGRQVHTVTSDGGDFDSGNILPGATWRRRFTTPGTFPYHCTPHPWMKALVRVTR